MSGKRIEVVAPRDQEGTKAVLQRWCHAVGATVTVDQPLFELETDKVVVEVAAPASGVLDELLKQPNDSVEPGEVVAYIRPADAQLLAPSVAQSAVPSASMAGALSPAVRRMLSENGLQPSQIAGTGRNDRITVQDVQAHLAQRPQAVTPPVVVPVAISRATRKPHSPMRRRIAEHLAHSVAVAPHVTSVFEADLSAVAAHRQRRAEEYRARGVNLTYTAYFVAASAQALRAVPEINSSYHEEYLELHDDCNIGVGTALGNDGLIVPVLHNAQNLSLFDIAQRLGSLVGAARAGSLPPESVRGGTFTISNHGVSGSLLAAPIIIPQPQVAILGVGKAERRMVIRELQGAEVQCVRTMCYVTLTVDHRAVDGFQANAFLTQWVSIVEAWPQD